MSKKKCAFCDNTTYKTLSNFWDIGWEAMQWGNNKVVCMCPNCKKLPNSQIKLLKESRKQIKGT